MKATLLVRPGCELCEEFEHELLAQAGPGVFEIEYADVDSRPEWRRRWGLKIPVLLDADGRVVCSAPFAPDMLIEYLRATKFRSAPSLARSH